MAMSGESQFPPLHHPRGDLILTHYLTLELSVGPTQRIKKKKTITSWGTPDQPNPCGKLPPVACTCRLSRAGSRFRLHASFSWDSSSSSRCRPLPCCGATAVPPAVESVVTLSAHGLWLLAVRGSRGTATGGKKRSCCCAASISSYLLPQEATPRTSAPWKIFKNHVAIWTFIEFYLVIL